MKREEFLKTLGISLAMVCAGTCFQACKKDGDEPEARGGNSASVDISTMASVGSQTTVNGVLFFRVAAGTTTSSFVATEASCPHQGGTLNWISGGNKIQCDRHAATYSSGGAVLSDPVGGGSTRNLKIYTLAVTGTTLTATKS